jgi:hypothetical protein
MQAAFTLRFDNSLWDAGYRFMWDKSLDKWDASDSVFLRDSAIRTLNGSKYAPLIIVSDNRDPRYGTAVGLYRPEVPVNLQPNFVRTNSDEGIGFNRDYDLLITDNSARIKNIAPDENVSLFGFKAYNRGILNPNRLAQGTREGYRNVYYILIGTPNQILENAKRIKAFSK